MYSVYNVIVYVIIIFIDTVAEGFVNGLRRQTSLTKLAQVNVICNCFVFIYI